VSGVTERRAAAVVVGAGVAGASAAAFLAQAMPDGGVVLVEQEALPAQHASGRSASVLSETSGHVAVCALARLSRPFFESPPTDFSDHALLSPRGLMWVGEHGDELLLDQLAVVGASIRPSVRRVTPDEVATHLPTFRPEAIAAGGVFEPDAMAIDTAAVMAGFVRMLRSSGGDLLVTAEAVQLERHDDGSWTVIAGEHRLRTPVVVNAAGAWVDEVARRAEVAPIGVTAMRRTAAIVPAPDSVSHWPLVMDIAGRYYCEPEAGGLLVSPADESPSEPCDAQPDELDVALALERVRDAAGLPLRAVRSAWAGLRTFAPDRAPVLGEDPSAPGFWWCAGQGGAGIKTSPAMGRLLALMVTGAPLPDEALSLDLRAAVLSPARFR
jgi:D-arginine dehydrogenase